MAKKANAFAAMKKAQKKLDARLAKAPVLDVSGVVDATDAGGAMSQGDKLWTMSFTFEGWRIADGRLHTGKLHLRRLGTDKALERLQAAVTPYAVLKVRARVIEEDDTSEALLEKVIGPETRDAELRAIARKLQQPVTREDKVFGKLTLDRRVNWYETKAKWNGKSVKLNLSLDGEDASDRDLAKALRTAHALWRDQPKWTRRIMDYAVAKLLPLKNQHWLGEGERPVSETTFRRRAKLDSITAYPSGGFDFWHTDGDLFLGHAILVRGDLKSGPNDADIPG
jgi:hypothetical protein